MANELTPIEQPEPEEKFDFSSPEDVLIEIIADEDADQSVPEWSKHSIETTSVISGVDGVIGAASYEKSYGGFLDYTVEGMVVCPGEGWWVVKAVTGHYSKGDGWTTDDDMDFYCEGVRRASAEEIAMA